MLVCGYFCVFMVLTDVFARTSGTHSAVWAERDDGCFWQWYMPTRHQAPTRNIFLFAVMLIPQGLAYASLATLPPVYGLYSAVVSMLVYPLFGTSPELAVGPTALMSLLTAGVMTELGTDEGEEGEQRRLEIALRLAFIMGVIQVVMGLCNAGVLVRFLSHPMLRCVLRTVRVSIRVSSPALSILTQRVHRCRRHHHWLQPAGQAAQAQTGAY